MSVMNFTDHYEIDEDQLILDQDGNVPLTYWPVAPNFGDELSRWLLEKLTGKTSSQK